MSGPTEQVNPRRAATADSSGWTQLSGGLAIITYAITLYFVLALYFNFAYLLYIGADSFAYLDVSNIISNATTHTLYFFVKEGDPAKFLLSFLFFSLIILTFLSHASQLRFLDFEVYRFRLRFILKALLTISAIFIVLFFPFIAWTPTEHSSMGSGAVIDLSILPQIPDKNQPSLPFLPSTRGYYYFWTIGSAALVCLIFGSIIGASTNSLSTGIIAASLFMTSVGLFVLLGTAKAWNAIFGKAQHEITIDDEKCFRGDVLLATSSGVLLIEKRKAVAPHIGLDWRETAERECERRYFSCSSSGSLSDSDQGTCTRNKQSCIERIKSIDESELRQVASICINQNSDKVCSAVNIAKYKEFITPLGFYTDNIYDILFEGTASYTFYPFGSIKSVRRYRAPEALNEAGELKPELPAGPKFVPALSQAAESFRLFSTTSIACELGKRAFGATSLCPFDDYFLRVSDRGTISFAWVASSTEHHSQSSDLSPANSQNFAKIGASELQLLNGGNGQPAGVDERPAPSTGVDSSSTAAPRTYRVPNCDSPTKIEQIDAQ